MKKMYLALPVVTLALLGGAMLQPVQAQSEAVQNAHKAQVKKELSQEQRTEVRELVQASREKMQPLRQQMFVKQQELKALQNAPTPDVAAVSAKATEITQLRAQIGAEKKNLGLALDKAMGLEPGTHAMRQFHRGKGHKGQMMAEKGMGRGERGKRAHDYDGKRHNQRHGEHN